jgi:predicted unusual protein kinase regulating ubiquinone biosynthesis (AarF/ABC1/UbiB family)
MAKKPSKINRFSQMMRFLRVSRLLLWTIWVIYRERRRVILAHQRGNYDVKPDVQVLVQVLEAFRETAVKLGVLMIKLGQFLSSRADLLPEQALYTLTSLQDEVPAAPFSHVVSVLEEELGKPIEQVFSVLERKAVAAASLGQVHKAVLAATGETVAVKIQRPNIEQLVRTDLSTLKFVIRLITRFIDTSDFIDLMAFYNEFKRTTYEEIDYITEASNAKRFKEMFKDDPTIYIPKVYEEYTSRRVLVLEWIDGIKINDYAALEAAGISRLEVANRTVRAYFHQFFEAGFFHADPHPGNIFVKKGTPESGPIVEFVDFGMVGSLTKGMKKALRALFLSMVTRDSRGLTKALAQLGFIGEGANMAAIEHGIALMIEQYYSTTLGEMDIGEVSHDIERLMYGQPIHIPAQFAFTGRAVSTLIGIATGLAPDFNFVAVATPYARKFMGLNAAGAGQTLQDLLTELVAASRVLLTLPRSLERVINKIDEGQLEVKATVGVPHSRPGRRGSRRDGSDSPSSIGGISWIVIFGSSLVGGIVLISNAHQMIPGWLFLALAGLTGLRMLFKR